MAGRGGGRRVGSRRVGSRRGGGGRIGGWARIAVALLALAGLSGCATDEPEDLGPGLPGADEPATTELVITVDETGTGAEVRSFTLTCDPPGGTHRDPAAACAAIEEAGGAVAFATPTDDMACTEQYGGPQVATAEGTVDGEPVGTTSICRTAVATPKRMIAPSP